MGWVGEPEEQEEEEVQVAPAPVSSPKYKVNTLGIFEPAAVPLAESLAETPQLTRAAAAVCLFGVVQAGAEPEPAIDPRPPPPPKPKPRTPKATRSGERWCGCGPLV